MPFDWKDYFTLAERLSKEPDTASKRTAIGRAYYYVYNTAVERAERTVGRPPKGRTGLHMWCWNVYSNTQDIACRRIGILGDRMLGRRIKADYHSLDIPRLDDEVTRTLEEARRFSIQISALDVRYPQP